MFNPTDFWLSIEHQLKREPMVTRSTPIQKDIPGITLRYKQLTTVEKNGVK
jgi:hypothetical protein